MMWLTMDLLVLWAMAQLCRSPFYLFRGNPQEIVSWKDLPNEMEAIKTTLDREWPGLRYFTGFSLFHSMPLFHPTSTTPEHSALISPPTAVPLCPCGLWITPSSLKIGSLWCRSSWNLRLYNCSLLIAEGSALVSHIGVDILSLCFHCKRSLSTSKSLLVILWLSLYSFLPQTQAS